ncbi:MAG: carboxypeptidase-like regulatory domain-containing protein [Candidatus Magasanikbacteria bacterium]|nr:carboxypeptidase-like regulatory domain-containing protein [Candidatus Magasanikbacteria bacterium]
MLKFIRWSLAAVALLIFFKADLASAATFYLEPASGNLIKGCTAQIRVKMSTDGQASNGAQVYVDYGALGGGTIGLSGAGLFSTYGTPPGVPAGTVGLFGYGGIVNGNALNYATVNVRSNINGALNLTVRYNAGDITSKIAAHPSSENILTGVTSGSYTVIDGYCETQPPYLTNLDPVPDNPNHPVGQNIKFDIRDDGSGLNMSTFSVVVKQNNIELPINVTRTAHGTDDKWYSIDINPVNDLTPELKVVVSASAVDKAGNAMSRTYQFNDLSCAQLGCSASAITPQCSDGVDNDGDGRIDFPADAGCANSDDNNEFSTGDYSCSTTPSGGIVTQCSDGVDNDNDNLIDLADPGCENETDNNEFVFGEVQCPTATSTPSTGGVVSLTDLKFYLANRTVEAVPNTGGSVEALSGFSLTVAADISEIGEQVSEVNLLLGENTYRLYYDNSLRMYAVDVTDLSAVGLHNAALTIDYGSSSEAVIPFTVSILTQGIINGKTRDGIGPVSGASVIAEQYAGGQYVQVARTQTSANGRYGFVLPNGTFRIRAEAGGFRTEQTSGFALTNHIVNRQFQLVGSVDLLDTNVPLTDKASYVASVAQDQVNKLIESADNPNVEKAAEQAVAPIALGSALLATVPALSLLSLLSYLRFLFLQPIFLFGRRKRKKWGIVYNSLSKMPIDLAIVRVIDSKTNRIVQSRVTDAEGRYAFFVEPGLYRLEVTKPGYVFPTKILQEFKEDTGFLDIYHGEPVHVDDKYVAIAANIPVDPAGVEERTPRRILIERWLRDVQKFIASLSIVAGIIAVVISPNWWTISLLVAQVALYYLFKRLSVAKKPKNWGIVYDKTDKKPIGRVVTRLFSKQFNKLVATEVTDNSGRYSFMVGPNEYFITFDKNGYDKTTSADIKIRQKNEVVKVDIGMEKSGMTPVEPPRGSQPPPAPPIVPPPAPPQIPPAVSPPPANLPIRPPIA